MGSAPAPANPHILNMQLQISMNKLQMENAVLREALQEAARRQAKENQKKKESLQMLAE